MVHRKSLKRRAGLAVAWLSAWAWPARRRSSLDQARVAGQAEDVIDPVRSHQTISASRAKPESARNRIRTLRPAGPDLGDDPRDLFNRPGAGIDVGAPQLGGQEMPAAEDVKRQIAVAVVVAVEEAAFLVAVQRIVGGVEIEDDLLGRPPCAVQEQTHEQPLRCAAPS